MKSLRHKLLAVLTVLFTCTMAIGASYIIGVSPNYSRQDCDTVLKGVLLFVLEGALPDDEIAVYDALNLKPVAKFQIPNEKLFEGNARARAQRLKSEMNIFRQFLAEKRDFTPAMEGVIHAPKFLAFAGAQLRPPGSTMKVVLIGSPFYMNDDEPAFNMNNAFPTDAHITAGENDSAFGTAQKKKALSGIIVHYAYLHECFINEFHRERTARFWSLFFQEQDGIMPTFAPDIGLAFERARKNVQQPCVAIKLDPNESKIEMRRVVPRSIPEWFGSTNLAKEVLVNKILAKEVPEPVTLVPNVISAASLPVAKNLIPVIPPAVVETNRSVAIGVTNPPGVVPKSEKTEKTVAVQHQPVSPTSEHKPGEPVNGEVLAIGYEEEPGNPREIPINVWKDITGIGIMWTADRCDFDLWVKPTPKSQSLSYKNQATQEGAFYRDYRDRNDGLDFEFVELKNPVDLNQVKAWVNFYAGRTKSPTGIVVVYYQGRTYRSTFKLTEYAGNHGQDFDQRGASPYWTQIDLKRIVGISK